MMVFNLKLRQGLTFPLGLTLLAIAILIERYFSGSDFVDFIAGFLFGLSMVLNCNFIYTISRQKNRAA